MDKSRRMIIEWDGFHGPEKYVLPYDEALHLIPILLKYVPCATITDYDHYIIHGEPLQCRACHYLGEVEPESSADQVSGEPTA